MRKVLSIKEAKKLVASGHQDECISELLNWFDSNVYKDDIRWAKMQNELMLISSSFNKNRNTEINFISRSSVIEITDNRITNSLLIFIDKLEEFIKTRKLDSLGNHESSYTSDIEITINKDFDSFCKDDQSILLATIANLLKISKGEINIKMIKRGSIKIVLELPRDKTIELKRLIEEGKLQSLNITNAHIVNVINLILIVEDPNTLSTITSQIEVYIPNINIQGTYTDLSEGLAAIEENPPNILLLDMIMLEASNFELLETLPKLNFELIFIISYGGDTVNAIKLSGISYLLKPIEDISELKNVFDRTITSWQKKQAVERLDIFKKLLKDQNDARPSQDCLIALPTFEKVEYVEIKNIVMIKAEKNYCKFFFTNQTSLLISRNIGYYDTSLSKFAFMKVNRSCLVNLNLVRSMSPNGNSIEMNNGTIIPVNATRRDIISKLGHL